MLLSRIGGWPFLFRRGLTYTQWDRPSNQFYHYYDYLVVLVRQIRNVRSTSPEWTQWTRSTSETAGRMLCLGGDLWRSTTVGLSCFSFLRSKTFCIELSTLSCQHSFQNLPPHPFHLSFFACQFHSLTRQNPPAGTVPCSHDRRTDFSALAEFRRSKLPPHLGLFLLFAFRSLQQP